MGKSRVWLGIDLGTQSVKVVATTSAGATVAHCSAPLTSTRTHGRHEQDPHEWWDATVFCLTSVVSDIQSSHTIEALATCATSGTLISVDAATLSARTPASMYDDARGQRFVKAINDTGHDLWHRLGYTIQGTWALPRMMDAIENGEIEPGEVFLTQADYITSQLAGAILPSDTSHTLKSGIDLDSTRWPEDIMKTLGISSSSLNTLARPGEIIGVVGPEASNLTGLPSGLPIVAGMTDGSAAQIAAGAIQPGEWNSVLGTTLVIKGASAQRKHDPSGALYCHRAPFDGGWWPGGASNTGANAIPKWLGSPSLEDLVVDFAYLDVAATAYPLAEKGERFPFVIPDASGFGIAPANGGLSLPQRFTEVALGVSLIERLCYDAVQLAGYEVNGAISFTGGASHNRGWNQLRADTLNRAIRVPQSTESAKGMAILACAAVTDPSPQGLSTLSTDMVTTEYTMSPDPENSRVIRHKYLALVDELRNREWISDELASFAREGVD